LVVARQDSTGEIDAVGGGSGVGGLAYRFKAESKLAIATIAWETNPIEESVDEVLRMSAGFNTAAQEYRDGEHFADTWLRERFSNGPLKREDIFGIWTRPRCLSDQQVYRAAQRLGVAKVKFGFSDGCLWALPEHTDALMERVGMDKERREEGRGKERVEIGGLSRSCDAIWKYYFPVKLLESTSCKFIAVPRLEIRPCARWSRRHGNTWPAHRR
jgi:hypothetical protein